MNKEQLTMLQKEPRLYCPFCGAFCQDTHHLLPEIKAYDPCWSEDNFYVTYSVTFNWGCTCGIDVSIEIN